MTGKHRENYNRNYLQYVNSFDPPTKHFKNCYRAFMVGGFICCIGQFFRYMLEYLLGLSGDELAGTVSILLIFLGTLLTGLGVYDRIGRNAGAGSIVPITGFANSVASPAMECHTEGLGYFAPTLEATQKVTRSTPNKHLKLRLKSISFRPDVRLKQAMTGVNAIRSKYTRHSLKLSEVEIDMKLKEYFADHDVLIRSDFQALCGMARTTANVHLKRLQQEGKLKNVEKPTQPIYRAMPGYYGVSRDAKAGR